MAMLATYDTDYISYCLGGHGKLGFLFSLPLLLLFAWTSTTYFRSSSRASLTFLSWWLLVLFASCLSHVMCDWYGVGGWY